MFQVMSYFGSVAPFLQASPEMSPATNQKLLEMLQNPTVKPYVQMELAAVVDAGEAFVKTTEILNTLTAGIQVDHYPSNLSAVGTVCQNLY